MAEGIVGGRTDPADHATAGDRQIIVTVGRGTQAAVGAAVGERGDLEHAARDGDRTGEAVRSGSQTPRTGARLDDRDGEARRLTDRCRERVARRGRSGQRQGAGGVGTSHAQGTRRIELNRARAAVLEGRAADADREEARGGRGTGADVAEGRVTRDDQLVGIQAEVTEAVSQAAEAGDFEDAPLDGEGTGTEVVAGLGEAQDAGTRLDDTARSVAGDQLVEHHVRADGQVQGIAASQRDRGSRTQRQRGVGEGEIRTAEGEAGPEAQAVVQGLGGATDGDGASVRRRREDARTERTGDQGGTGDGRAAVDGQRAAVEGESAGERAARVGQDEIVRRGADLDERTGARDDARIVTCGDVDGREGIEQIDDAGGGGGVQGGDRRRERLKEFHQTGIRDHAEHRSIGGVIEINGTRCADGQGIIRGQRARDGEQAGVHGRETGIGVDLGEFEFAGALLDEAKARADDRHTEDRLRRYRQGRRGRQSRHGGTSEQGRLLEDKGEAIGPVGGIEGDVTAEDQVIMQDYADAEAGVAGQGTAEEIDRTRSQRTFVRNKFRIGSRTAGAEDQRTGVEEGAARIGVEARADGQRAGAVLGQRRLGEGFEVQDRAREDRLREGDLIGQFVDGIDEGASGDISSRDAHARGQVGDFKGGEAREEGRTVGRDRGRQG